MGTHEKKWLEHLAEVGTKDGMPSGWKLNGTLAAFDHDRKPPKIFQF